MADAKKDDGHFPSWRYGPNGKSAIFESEADVPKGWEDHPSKVKDAAPAPKSPITAARQGTRPTAGQHDHTTAADKAELDAHGHPFSPDLHAATKSKTKDGLWRMKVGVSRPDPAPGYPLDL